MTEILFYDDVFVEFIDKLGSDDRVLEAARVSTKKSIGHGAGVERDQRINKRVWAEHFDTPEEAALFSDSVVAEEYGKDKGLINMLTRDRHGSPFEHCVITVYVKAPIFVFREWHRHRIASYNEMSGRYTELLPQFYIQNASRPLLQIGKPGAYTFEPGTEEQQTLVEWEGESIARAAWESYQRQLQAGIAKEVAREVLPLSIYSQMYCTINLRSLMNFLSLRTKTKENSAIPSFPQHEISLGADKLEAIFAKEFPWVYEAWNNNGRVAP